MIVSKGRSLKVSINLDIKRGDLYYADLSPVVGSEQGGVRPVLIIQNDILLIIFRVNRHVCQNSLPRL